MHATTPKPIRFLDTETTGTDKHKDRVISVGLVEIANGRIDKVYEWFFNPGDVEIHPDAQKVHGITKEFLKDKPPIRGHLPELLGFAHEAIMGGHNLGFDLDMLDMECRRNGFPLFSEYLASVIDTMKMSKEKFPGGKASLDALCAKLKISTAHRTKHGAALDAELSALCYLEMSREQLSMFDGPGANGGKSGPGEDFGPMPEILVIKASDEELSAHEACLAVIEKENKLTTVWRQMQSEQENSDDSANEDAPAMAM